jgi:hypothetical protein
VFPDSGAWVLARQRYARAGMGETRPRLSRPNTIMARHHIARLVCWMVGHDVTKHPVPFVSSLGNYRRYRSGEYSLLREMPQSLTQDSERDAAPAPLRE